MRKPHSRGGIKITSEEARAIVDLAVRIVSEDADAPDGFHRLSKLHGYSVFDVDTALKIQIAEEFAVTRGDSDMEAKFDENLKLYQNFAFSLHTAFVPDEALDAIEQLPLKSPERIILRAELMTRGITGSSPESEQWLHLETPDSFADYCKHVGADHPLYWEKIYTRIGQQYPR